MSISVDMDGRGAFLFLALLLLLPLERLVPIHGGWRALRAQWKTDVAHLVLNRIAVKVMMAVAAVRLIGLLVPLVPDALRTRVGGLPLWVQLPLALIVADLFQYLSHRLRHRVPWLWRFHRVHHSAEHLDMLASVRSHPVDVVLGRAMVLGPLLMLGFNLAALAAFAGVLGLYGLLLHANIQTRLGPLEQILVSPLMHRTHHSAAAEHIDTNFGGLLALWDRALGTWHLPTDWPAHYGADEPAPDGWWAQMTWPWAPPADETPTTPSC